MNNKVKIVCPCCGAKTYRSSIDSLLGEVEKLWVPWLLIMAKVELLTGQEYLTVEQRELIQTMNTKERLEQILAQKGEIKMFCPLCIVTKSTAIAERIKKQRGQTE